MDTNRSKRHEEDCTWFCPVRCACFLRSHGRVGLAVVRYPGADLGFEDEIRALGRAPPKAVPAERLALLSSGAVPAEVPRSV